MKFANIAGRTHLSVGDGYADLAETSAGTFPADPAEALERWAELRQWVDQGGLDGAATRLPEPDEFLAPSPRPRQIFAVGLNYAAHADEVGMGAGDKFPLTFTKFASSLAPAVGPLVLSSDSVDWEVELVVVIGATCVNVPRTEAWDAVAGITIGQDYSDRGVQMTGSPPQFSLGKSFSGFAPVGPALVTVDEVADRNTLDLACLVNDERVQHGSTANLIHPVDELIAMYSSVCTLYPGDLIFTGTPDGVGMGRTPPRYLKPGDRVVSRIGALGELVQECVAGCQS